MNSELKKEALKIVELLTQIINEENFTVYVELRNCYTKVLNILETKFSIELIKEEIKWNCRRVSEAPPKNKELGLKALIAMDNFTKK